QTDVQSTTVLLFAGDGTGNLLTGQTITVGQNPQTTLAADFNHDGHMDMAVSNRGDATMSILLGDGHGGFTTKAVLPVAVLPAP
ncbi:MAG TPA: VCBS repeat-containing protein, partial [Steroidobacteraceae bacterium]